MFYLHFTFLLGHDASEYDVSGECEIYELSVLAQYYNFDDMKMSFRSSYISEYNQCIVVIFR